MKKRKGEMKQKILEAIKKSSKPIRPLGASKLAGVNKNTARWCCLKLYEEGKIERIKRGYYTLKK